MKIYVMDSKLCKHIVEVDDGASVAQVKLLLADMSLVPSGFVPKLVYQKRMLGDDEHVASIGYIPERCISLVCTRSTPSSTAVSPELHSQPTESNAPASAGAQQAPSSPTALQAPSSSTAFTAAVASENSTIGLSQPHPVIFSMGFDETLVHRALAQTGGDEQGAVDLLISGRLHVEEPSALSSQRDACMPTIFSMGFDDALVRRALASAGGDEQQAVELLLSGSVPSSPHHSPVTMSGATTAAFPLTATRISGGGMACPQGHPCILWTYKKLHSCDLRDNPAFSAACQRQLKVDEQGFRCEVCDYDVCSACCKAATATAPTDAMGQNVVSSDSTVAPAAPPINFATEWLY
jgi:hypothetical protein